MISQYFKDTNQEIKYCHLSKKKSNIVRLPNLVSYEEIESEYLEIPVL